MIHARARRLPGPRVRLHALESALRQKLEKGFRHPGRQGQHAGPALSNHARRRSADQLRRTLSCTNVIESAFSIVETVCRNVKRWREGDQIERWVGSGLLIAEQQFRKVIDFRQIPLLVSAMAQAVLQKSIAKKAAIA